jgi:hypothetical protein
LKEWGVGNWTVPLSLEFKRVGTSDSIEFSDGRRALHVDTMDIQGRDRPSPTAAELHKSLEKPFRSKGGTKDFEMSGPENFGRAELIRERSDMFHLGTSREADGSVLTCTFTFPAETDLDWALSVWRAISHP